LVGWFVCLFVCLFGWLVCVGLSISFVGAFVCSCIFKSSTNAIKQHQKAARAAGKSNVQLQQTNNQKQTNGITQAHTRTHKQARKQTDKQKKTKQTSTYACAIISSEMHWWACYAMCLFSFVSILGAVCVMCVCVCIACAFVCVSVRIHIMYILYKFIFLLVFLYNIYKYLYL
jgi:Flp pilus assembly protein TadB